LTLLGLPGEEPVAGPSDDAALDSPSSEAGPRSTYTRTVWSAFGLAGGDAAFSGAVGWRRFDTEGVQHRGPRGAAGLQPGDEGVRPAGKHAVLALIAELGGSGGRTPSLSRSID